MGRDEEQLCTVVYFDDVEHNNVIRGLKNEVDACGLILSWEGIAELWKQPEKYIRNF